MKAGRQYPLFSEARGSVHERALKVALILSWVTVAMHLTWRVNT